MSPHPETAPSVAPTRPQRSRRLRRFHMRKKIFRILRRTHSVAWQSGPAKCQTERIAEKAARFAETSHSLVPVRRRTSRQFGAISSDPSNVSRRQGLAGGAEWIRTRGSGCFGATWRIPADFGSPLALIGAAERDRRATGLRLRPERCVCLPEEERAGMKVSVAAIPIPPAHLPHTELATRRISTSSAWASDSESDGMTTERA